MAGLNALADSESLISPRSSACGQNLRVLKSRHPNLKHLIEKIGPLSFDIPLWKSIDKAVLYAVIGQMLSVKASCSIICRLLNRFGSAGKVISWAEKSAQRQGAVCGVSKRKRSALKAWSAETKKRGRFWEQWPAMELEEFKRDVTGIWGFGNWSADMIAIFYLGRNDVWPETDMGLQNAAKAVFGASAARNFKNYIRGYETVAALYFWEYLNRNPRLSFNKTR